MTHDELLAKVDTLEARYTDYPTYLALRAVVELHKPTALSWSDETKEYYCATCGDVAWVPYPCETIEVIEKELA